MTNNSFADFARAWGADLSQALYGDGEVALSRHHYQVLNFRANLLVMFQTLAEDTTMNVRIVAPENIQHAPQPDEPVEDENPLAEDLQRLRQGKPLWVDVRAYRKNSEGGDMMSSLDADVMLTIFPATDDLPLRLVISSQGERKAHLARFVISEITDPVTLQGEAYEAKPQGVHNIIDRDRSYDLPEREKLATRPVTLTQAFVQAAGFKKG